MTTAPYSWWGKWFPRGHRFSWWRRWFPEPPADLTLQPASPSGMALVLEGACKITLKWDTGISFALDGSERRSCNNDDPTRRYEGIVHLAGDEVRTARARLARGSAQGATYLLGLPFDELIGSSPAVGAELPVNPAFLALCDWAVDGQRVVVSHQLYGSVADVIQSVGPDSITIANAPGNIGSRGFRVMPADSILLDQQQGIMRLPTKVGETLEKWQLRGSSSIANYSQAPLPAKLQLNAHTSSGNLDGLWYEARLPGAAGNSIVVTQSDDALTSSGELIEDTTARTLHVKYMGDTTTVAELIALVNGGSTLTAIRGTADGTEVVNTTDDEFTSVALSGGSDEIFVDRGKGATLTTFEGRPVWDRGIRIAGSATDQIQTLASIENLGGLPFAQPTANQPTLGRAIGMKRPCPGPYWQWLLLFLFTVKGAWRSFWLSTDRPDLTYVSKAAGTITVAASEAGGDVFAFYPYQRTCLAIVLADKSVTYARISSATPIGANAQLAIVDQVGNPITIVGTVAQISWLELVRLSSDEVTISIAGRIFEVGLTAKTIKELPS
jgi:hypothetical protein